MSSAEHEPSTSSLLCSDSLPTFLSESESDIVRHLQTETMQCNFADFRYNGQQNTRPKVLCKLHCELGPTYEYNIINFSFVVT